MLKVLSLIPISASLLKRILCMIHQLKGSLEINEEDEPAAYAKARTSFQIDNLSYQPK